MPLRAIFMGTPDFSVPVLAEIVGAGHDVVSVYSQPPRRSGRGMSERPSPVHAFAEKMGLEVRTPTSLKSDEEQQGFAALEADIAVVVAYGLILPKAILEAPELGCLNAHASLLPRWRGAAPIQRAIMAGDEETGICIMQMDEGLDTGSVCLMEKMSIGTDMTAGELHDGLSHSAASAMGRALGAAERGLLTATPQAQTGVTYAAKIDKSEARIDFSKPAKDVHNHIRGLSPFPGAWFETEDGTRVKVLRSALSTADENAVPGTVLNDTLTIACGTSAVNLVSLQRAGKGAMGVEDFLRGMPLAAGVKLG
ncbi:MAG: methionyl-tRNA formyltransferase [Hyphomicrobiales bacterium]